MATYLMTDLMQEILVAIGRLEGGIATGGSTTTVADTVNLAARNDTLAGGIVFCVRDGGGADAAPHGQFSQIASYATPTITFSPAMTVAMASGDDYGITVADISLSMLRQAVRSGLRALGPLPSIDTSLTTAAGKTEYTIPAAAKRDLRQVWIQTNSDSDDNKYRKLSGWEQVQGDTNDLHFSSQLETGKTLLLRYMAVHSEMRDFDDELSEYAPFNRSVWECAVRLVQQIKGGGKQTDESIISDLNFTMSERAEARRSERIPQTLPTFKGMLLGLGRSRGRRSTYGPWLVE